MEHFRQGDLYFLKVACLPSGVTADAPRDGTLIVGHSETGHHHVAVLDRQRKPSCQLYSGDNPLIAWLEVNRPTALEHRRSFDTHKTITIPPGIYEIRRQREYVPEGFRRVQD
jgi:hypothetical protein